MSSVTTTDSKAISAPAAAKPAAQVQVAAPSRREFLFYIWGASMRLDVEAVRRRAIERGLVTAEDAGRYSTEQLVELVFHPGLSTAASLTTISGRGVGMDVIRSIAEELGGTVKLQTLHGIGTRLRVEIPARLHRGDAPDNA